MTGTAAKKTAAGFYVITGSVGAGKSTVLRAVLAELQQAGVSCDGLLTLKRGDALFVRHIQSGEEALFARQTRDNRGQSCSRYDFFSAGAEFAGRALAAAAGAQVFMADELGSLELENRGFQGVFALLEQRRFGVNLLVVRKKVLHLYEKKLHLLRRIYTVREENRDLIPTEIADTIRSIILQ